MNDLFNELMKQFIMYAVPALSALLIGYIVKFLKDWKLKTKYHTMSEIIDIITIIVNSIYQEFIKDIKNDNKFTSDKKKEYKDLAIQEIKKTLNNHKKKLLKSMFKDLGNLDVIIGKLIENRIYEAKSGNNIKWFFKYDMKF